MKGKRIKMVDGTEWHVVAETTYGDNEYLLCCDTQDVELIAVLKHQVSDNNHLFVIETDEDVLTAVCPILEKLIKED